jgi:membrane-associated phospholipid phosphatase
MTQRLAALLASQTETPGESIAPGNSLVAILFVVVVGWSRVQLRRHTWLEVGVGLLVGMLVCRLILA